MEQRFKFIAPSARELALSKKGNLLLPVAVVVWIGINFINWPNAILKLSMGLIITLFIIWLIIRLGDIQRRETQADHGFVELTERELRVSLSLRSLLRVQWHDFKGTEEKNGWLQFQHLDAQIEQGGQKKRLDRVRLSELQSPDDLLEALRARTAALDYLKQ
ncbi:hypothetical protein IAD21_01373 [Abditibacteriota bacterium]|nr:hypothetical protein IAD21_01373 [Abditibacteriota bacterium]